MFAVGLKHVTTDRIECHVTCKLFKSARQALQSTISIRENNKLTNFPPKCELVFLAGNSNCVSSLFSRIQTVLCNAYLAL